MLNLAPGTLSWSRSSGHREVQRGMDGVTEAVTWERGCISVMMEGARMAAVGSKATQRHWASCIVDKQRACGAGSVRRGMELKMFTAGMNSLMVAAGDKATTAPSGRDASAAADKLQLVSLRLKKNRSLKDRICRNFQSSCRSCLDLLRRRSHFLLLSSFNTIPSAHASLIAVSRFLPLSLWLTRRDCHLQGASHPQCCVPDHSQAAWRSSWRAFECARCQVWEYRWVAFTR